MSHLLHRQHIFLLPSTPPFLSRCSNLRQSFKDLGTSASVNLRPRGSHLLRPPVLEAFDRSSSPATSEEEGEACKSGAVDVLIDTFVIRGMSCVPYLPSAATVSQSRRLIMRSSMHGFSSKAWKRTSTWHAGIRPIDSDTIWKRFTIRCYSARRTRASLPVPDVDSGPPAVTEKDAFYVVRKGDIVAIYKSLSDCQAQVGSSVCFPSASVYKGYSLHKESEEYLASFGLKNAIYSIHSVDVKADLFGTLVPCPFQQPDGLALSTDEASQKTSDLKRTTEDLKLGNSELYCVVEFDGAAGGNPGKGGAGAILRSEDGSVVSRVREGLGVVTNNVAEYRAMILGMKSALKRGFMNIRMQGDSKLVCLQVQKLWRTRHANLIDHYKEAKELKDKFLSFEIRHVKREFNSDADALANLGKHLPDGEVYEEDLKAMYTSASSKQFL